MNGVTVESLDECVRIRLNINATNTLTTAVLQTLRGELEKAQNDAQGIMLCGGDKFFSNGVDLPWALQQSPAGMREMFLELGQLILHILESPIPIVGVIKGHAIGGAMALLMACDYRYGATGRVLMGKPEILLGVPNPYYGDQLLRFVASDVVASDLIYTGRLVEVESAVALGLIHGVADKNEVEAVAWRQLLFLRDLNPAAFAESKSMRNGKFCADVRAQLSARVARQVEIWNSGDAQRRLHAAAERLSR